MRRSVERVFPLLSSCLVCFSLSFLPIHAFAQAPASQDSTFLVGRLLEVISTPAEDASEASGYLFYLETSDREAGLVLSRYPPPSYGLVIEIRGESRTDSFGRSYVQEIARDTTGQSWPEPEGEAAMREDRELEEGAGSAAIHGTLVILGALAGGFAVRLWQNKGLGDSWDADVS